MALFFLILPSSCRASQADTPSGDPFVRHEALSSSAENVVITLNGMNMYGILLEAQGRGPHPTVLIARGLPDYLGNIDVGIAAWHDGFNVLSFNYRGCWGSDGEFTLGNALDDVMRAIRFLRDDARNTGRVDPARIILFGYSLGGSVVLRAAAQDRRIHAVVLVEPTDIRGVIEEAATVEGRQELVRAFESMSGIRVKSGKTIVDELLNDREAWNPIRAVGELLNRPLLLVVASRGTGSEPPIMPNLAEELRRVTRLTSVELDADHDFSSHRFVLAAAVTNWLRQFR